MVQFLIEVPDNLALRLYPVQNRMVEIIERGLVEITSPPPLSPINSVHHDLIECLREHLTPQQIIAFQPPATLLERLEELFYKNRTATITPSEKIELEQYVAINNLMTKAKAKARYNHN